MVSYFSNGFDRRQQRSNAPSRERKLGCNFLRQARTTYRFESRVGESVIQAWTERSRRRDVPVTERLVNEARSLTGAHDGLQENELGWNREWKHSSLLGMDAFFV